MQAAGITLIPYLEDDLFRRDYSGVAPALIRSFVGASRACARWSAEYLDSVIGDRMVRVSSCPRALEKTTQGAQRATSPGVEMPFREASRLIRGSSAEVYFLTGQPLRQVLPELLPDLDFNPLIMRAAPLVSVNFWYAGGGHLTPLHYDRYDNFLNQIIGRKKVTLFAPSDKEYLYSTSDSRARTPATVNLFEPDYEQFPHFGRATPIEFVMEPGDTLYLPADWSHQIESLDVAVSVNFFFKREESQAV
jgi:ribosomal protein L16 Arg81 hydroxylase